MSVRYVIDCVLLGHDADFMGFTIRGLPATTPSAEDHLDRGVFRGDGRADRGRQLDRRDDAPPGHAERRAGALRHQDPHPQPHQQALDGLFLQRADRHDHDQGRRRRGQRQRHDPQQLPPDLRGRAPADGPGDDDRLLAGAFPGGAGAHAVDRAGLLANPAQPQADVQAPARERIGDQLADPGSAHGHQGDQGVQPRPAVQRTLSPRQPGVVRPGQPDHEDLQFQPPLQYGAGDLARILVVAVGAVW